MVCRYTGRGQIQSLIVRSSIAKLLLRFAICGAIVLALVYAYTSLIRVNPTTVALTFLLSVLVVSAKWGLLCSLFQAVVAAAAYNYYFLPPVGTFTISDPQNWVAL